MEHALDILKALADRNRSRVVTALSHYEELCACQITEFLKVSGATASRHLDVLRKAGLVETRKEGRWVYFRLTVPEGADPLVQWLLTALEESDEMNEDLLELEQIIAITREDLCRKQRGE